MSETNPNPTPTREQELVSDHEGWLARNTGPLLAIITVLMTFGMFAYFVSLANSPSKESANLRREQHALKQVESKFGEISSSKTERAVVGKLAEVRKERERSRMRVTHAMEEAEDARDRRGVMKEYIMYILGVLSSALTTILAYYFGSSKGSADKSTALNIVAAKSHPPTPVPHVTAAQAAADKEKNRNQAAAG